MQDRHPPATGLADLPPELLQKVFKELGYLGMLRTVPRVCRAFRKAFAIRELDLTGNYGGMEPGPGRTLESLENTGQTEGLVQWVQRHGTHLQGFRAALGKLESCKASQILAAISSKLGSELRAFEIATTYQTDCCGLTSRMLPVLAAEWKSMISIELSLAGPLMDEHLQALAYTNVEFLFLSYPQALSPQTDRFEFTQAGWKGFGGLRTLELEGGGIHHTLGLGELPLDDLRLRHCSRLSLQGLATSSTLSRLALVEPDLIHSETLSWFQPLQSISSLKHLDLEGPLFGEVHGTSAVLSQLLLLSQLVSIDLSNWKPPDRGLDPALLVVPPCQQLTSLCLRGNLHFLCLDFAALSGLKALTLIMPIRSCSVDMSHLTNLTSLMIQREDDDGHNALLDVTWIGQLLSLNTLQLIDCVGLHFPQDRAWEPLARSPSLRVVDLNGSSPSQDHMSWLQMAEFILSIKDRGSLPPVELKLW